MPEHYQYNNLLIIHVGSDDVAQVIRRADGPNKMVKNEKGRHLKILAMINNWPNFHCVIKGYG